MKLSLWTHKPRKAEIARGELTQCEEFIIAVLLEVE